MASNENIPEISLLATEFRARIKSAYQDGGVKAPRKIQFLGTFTDGSRYLVEDGVRAISFYLVTDLKSPSTPASGSDIYAGANLTTASLTFVSSGRGISAGFTPTTTGIVYVALHADMSNNTASDGVQCAIFYNTTGVPVNGTAVGTDTQVAKDQIPTILTATERRSMSVIGLLTLVVGTTYYFYSAFSALTGGTATLVGVQALVLVAIELAKS